MGTLGVQEMIVIFFLALILFGPKKLPELGRTIGKAITEFRRASNDLKATFEREMQTLERESQSISQVTNITAGDIFNRAINYNPEREDRSLPRRKPLGIRWSRKKWMLNHRHQIIQTPASESTSLSTATDPSTVGASAIPGAEST